MTGSDVNSNWVYGIYSNGEGIVLSNNTVCANGETDLACEGTQLGSANTCTSNECPGVACETECTPEPPACAPGWAVQSCPCLLTTPHAYTMNSDLTCSGLGVLITQSAAGTTLDCGGHSITGASDYTGIYLGGASDSAVKNCVVSNFWGGIEFNGADRCNLTGNTLTSNYEGAYIQECTQTLVAGNNFNSNQEMGLAVGYSEDTTITGNVINGSRQGLYLTYSTNAMVSANTANSNFLGLYVSYCDGFSFSDNTFCDNYGQTVYCNAPQTDGGGNICEYSYDCAFECGECPPCEGCPI